MKTECGADANYCNLAVIRIIVQADKVNNIEKIWTKCGEATYSHQLTPELSISNIKWFISKIISKNLV